MDTRRKELGDFLRVLRQRCAPEAFGFPQGSRRRTPGLRREEVAQLAGISPTWYTWIEQGRDVQVSHEVLERIAQALRLTGPQRSYLFDVAGRSGSDAQGLAGLLSGAEHAPDALSELLEDFHMPAYILGRYWDILAWNRAAMHLFAGWLDQSWANDAVEEATSPNLLRFVFLEAQARQLVVDWENRARRICAEFRADCRSRLEEPGLQRLIDELQQGSVEFARYWKLHDVLERQGGERSFRHPHQGLIHYRQFTLSPVGQEHLKLVLLKPLPA
ncbi:MAG: helix-turn-helix transcriptional regulator [Sterolibacterium sp.]|nr:helix-turn-helix transcriptional regulator [Sterolibacterium sp.]